MAQQDILPPIHEDDRMLSGLVYPLWLFLGPIVLYGSKREEPYLHFNALQAIVLGASSLGLSLLVFFVTWFLMWVLPGSFITMSAVMGIVIFTTVVLALLFYLTFVLFVAWRVANGKFLRLPFIGTWAEKRMQQNLNITPESYSTAVFGEKRTKAILSQFDYRNAPGYVEEDFDDNAVSEGENPEDAYYNPDTDTYEYVSEADNAEALLSYEQANAPQPSANPPSVAKASPTAARPSGYQARVSSPPAKPSGSAGSGTDGFKPLSYQFGKTMPGGSTSLGSGSKNIGASTTIDGGSFKPLTPQPNARAAEPVVAGQRSAPGQFKPLMSQNSTKQQQQPAARNAPRFQWLDFDQSGSGSKPAPPAPETGSSSAASNPSGDNSFKPGLMGSKSSSRSVAPRVQWDKLGDS
ncbi:hypothetical protein IJT17_09490 [bacterium]|nr:hypothetical protein [bacterium]